jgi:DNA mismatch endonuclease, patch repair protein
MRGNRRKDTTPELSLRRELHRRGLRYRVHVEPLGGRRCRADIVFPGRRLAVFVDGCFWHRCPVHGVEPRTNSEYWAAKLERNVTRDRLNDEALVAAGWEVLRVWEHEDARVAADRVEAALSLQP